MLWMRFCGSSKMSDSWPGLIAVEASPLNVEFDMGIENPRVIVAAGWLAQVLLFVTFLDKEEYS